MTRFYFDLWEDEAVLQDPEGVELYDLAAARDRAVREARALMAAGVLGGLLDLGSHIAVRTHEGPAFGLPFDEALQIKHPSRDG